MKRKPFTKRKVFKQLLVILIELELIGGVFLCVGVSDAYADQMSLFEQRLEKIADRVTVDILKVSALPSLSANAGVSAYIENHRWKGPVLSKSRGTITGPSGKETYYNLNMSGVVRIMRRMGNTDEYWVRDDGVKMLGDYVMVAANLNIRPRGSLIETSLGTGIVCDTGGFASRNPTQLDIAVTW